MHSSRALLRPSSRFYLVLAVLTLLWVLLSLLAPVAHAQNFPQPKVIATGNWPIALYTADVNADGFPDLIYIDAGATATASTTHVLLNDGKGNFTQSASLSTAGTSVAIGDFDGDGILDIAFVGYNPIRNAAVPVEIYRGLGAGSFAQQAYQYGLLPTSANYNFAYLRAAQFTAGGHTFFLAEDTMSNLLAIMWSAPPTLSFLSLQTLSLPDGTGPISIVDLNGDGIADLIVDGLSGASAQIFLSSPGLPNSPTHRFSGLTGVRSLLVQDVNFDGLPDLIVEGAAGHIDVFPGNGDGTFQTTSIGGTGPLDGTTGNGGHLIAIGDFNGDGLPDALTATPAGISTLLGNGTAYLGLKGIANAGPVGGSGHPSYVTADFNGDGSLDLAVDSPEGIAILYGNPDGSFQTSLAFAANQPAMSGALGAFTSSSHLDAVVGTAAAQAQILLGQGDGTFITAPAPTTLQTGTPGLIGTVQAADVNHDGKLDLVNTADGPPAALPATGYGVSLQLGDGQGSFAAPVSIPSSPTTSCMQHPAPLFGVSALADFNGDGFLDIANRDFNGLRIFNTTTATPPPVLFANLQATPCELFPHNIVVAGDFNADGRSDLFLQSDGHLQLYLGSGGQFNVAAGDLSVDGSLTTTGRALAPALSSTFGGTVAVSAGGLGFPAAIGSAVVADLDGDGNNDLLVAYDNMGADHTAPNSTTAPNSIYIWYGSGGGKFLATARHPVNPLILIPERNNYQLAIADINGDKIPDLIMSDGYVITVAYGVGDGSFGAEKHFLAGQGINTISVGDVDGDGKPDLVIANGGAVFGNPVANKDLLATNPDVNTGGITVLLNQTPQSVPLLPTSLSLLLCVDDPGSLFPCATPIGNTPLISPITMYYGQTLDGVAVESSTTLSGTITFYDGTRIFCTISANLTGAGPGGNACPSNSGHFHAGNRIVDAAYSGDSINAASTSNSIAVNVFPDLTTSAIASSLNPAVVGQTVTFTATVSGNFATPVGNVTFFDGLTQIGTATLDSTGHATFTTSTLAVGSHPIAVAYSGTPDFNPAPPVFITQIITPVLVPVQSIITLTSSVNPSAPAQQVTFTAGVSAAGASLAGNVTFLDGSVILGVGAIDPTTGIARFVISTLALGSHPITATYPGSVATSNAPVVLAATSAILTQVVAYPAGSGSFTLTVSPSPIVIGAGRTGLLLVTVTANSGFAQPVALACSGLAPETACTFIQPVVPSGGGSTTLQLSTSAPHDCGDPDHPYFLGRNNLGSSGWLPRAAGVLFPSLLLLGIGCTHGRRKLRGMGLTLLLLGLSLAGLSTFSGCGRCTDLGTFPGKYTFTISAAAQGGPVTESQSQTISLGVTIP